MSNRVCLPPPQPSLDPGMAPILGQLFCSGRLIQASSSCSLPWPAMHLYRASTQWGKKVAGPLQVHIQTSASCQVIPGRIRKRQAGTGRVRVQARGCLAAAVLLCPILWSPLPLLTLVLGLSRSHADSQPAIFRDSGRGKKQRHRGAVNVCCLSCF